MKSSPCLNPSTASRPGRMEAAVQNYSGALELAAAIGKENLAEKAAQQIRELGCQ